MVLGDHGRKFLAPMTFSQKVYAFPYAQFYKRQLYFRAMCGSGIVLTGFLGWLMYKGVNITFTPYQAVHHSISHKFAHDQDHARYPPAKH